MTGEQERYDRLMGQLKEELGADIMTAVIDEAVTGIKVGDDGLLMIKKHSQTWEETGDILNFDRRVRVLNLIANELGKTLNEASSELSGEIPFTGSRIQGWVPPTADAVLVIRRHSSQLFTLDDYVRAGICTQEQADVLRWHVLNHSNIVVAGAVDSGKTTALNALLAEITGMEHVIYVEDTTELRGPMHNCLRLKTSESKSMRDLLKSCLRLDPDRVIVGETRGAEALDMLEIWDTGRRGGMTTLHADSAHGVLRRLGQLCLKANEAPPWEVIGNVIDLIVYIKMTRDGRRITEIMEVNHERLEGNIPVELKRIDVEHPQRRSKENGTQNH